MLLVFISMGVQKRYWGVYTHNRLSRKQFNRRNHYRKLTRGTALYFWLTDLPFNCTWLKLLFALGAKCDDKRGKKRAYKFTVVGLFYISLRQLSYSENKLLHWIVTRMIPMTFAITRLLKIPEHLQLIRCRPTPIWDNKHSALNTVKRQRMGREGKKSHFHRKESATQRLVALITVRLCWSLQHTTQAIRGGVGGAERLKRP